MAMKQTQTKLFDFSDVGLDFCAGSKNLFPDRFKRMLALGYNSQTVATVSVLGNQVTFEYGVSHGYVAERVLKVSSGPLAAIHGGEFVIDSVTATSLTMTIDDAPISISGGFATRIAPLGWSLEYENANIHIYKMKHSDESDRFVRFCFQNNTSHRNAIAVCVGKTWDSDTGKINDETALQSTSTVNTPNVIDLPRWDFSYTPSSAHNDWSYSQGFSIYGKGLIIGSPYHVIMLNRNSNKLCQLNAILPVSTYEYEQLKYPVILCNLNDKLTNVEGYAGSIFWGDYRGAAFIGNTRFRFDLGAGNNLLANPIKANNSILPSNYDSFNTTTCIPIQLYEYVSKQFVGFCIGMYLAMFGSDAIAPETTSMPLKTSDIDLNSLVYLQDASGVTQKNNATFVAIPVEKIKNAENL
ncbi:hypothetical protein M5F66_01350 [Acinetobacter sp. ANC 5033]|uniref:hypothetical protein n=1 Tax=Acinetobacter amyesii TaxID=2942470 RepID=UPI00201B8A03|nr:hypothetical protein [Acinetobacter amyesii]MCL6236998.1 hypothetical protein [Acinetobacter amyesii]